MGHNYHIQNDKNPRHWIPSEKDPQADAEKTTSTTYHRSDCTLEIS